MIDSSIFLPVKEASDIFGISVQAMHKFLKENAIKTHRLGAIHKIAPESFEQLLIKRQLKKIAKKVVVSCVKGGVGKTSITSALSVRTALLGQKVLVIDLDQQANLTTSLGIDSSMSTTPSLVDLYRGFFSAKRIGLNDIIIKIHPYLHLIPSNLGMASFETEINSKTENIGTFFNQILSPVLADYDVVWIDCPPALGKITSAAQAFGDIILVPVTPDKFSLDGLDLTISSILSLAKKFSINPEVKVVINKFDQRQKLGFEVLQKLTSGDYKNFVCDNFISTSKQIDNCIAAKKSIWDPRSKNLAHHNLSSLLNELFKLNTWKSSKSYQGSNLNEENFLNANNREMESANV